MSRVRRSVGGAAAVVLVAGFAMFVQQEGSASPESRPAVSRPVAQAETQPTTHPTTEPTKELTLNLGGAVSMRLVLIPAGKFTMGSQADEKARSSVEGPQREVTITKSFYMGVFEVTQEQYQVVVGVNPGHYKNEQNPVEMVSWDDAAAFCKAASQRTGRTVTLPTEAQWEYACRAGTTTRFHYGDDDSYTKLGDYAWYRSNSDRKTHPVGQKKPNALGLYDMCGNVWEWCWDQDWSYTNAATTDPAGPNLVVVGSARAARVLRGGSVFNSPEECRSAYRNWNSPAVACPNYGFRVVVAGDVGEID